MLEHTIFNNWYYGTGFESVDENKINIGVFNPAGIRSLLARNDCNVLVIWIKTDDKTRLLRQLNREDDPDVREVIRRFQADYNDFDNIEYRFISLPNDHEEDLMWNVEEILS
jgi:guanylate kinase